MTTTATNRNYMSFRIVPLLILSGIRNHLVTASATHETYLFGCHMVN